MEKKEHSKIHAVGSAELARAGKINAHWAKVREDLLHQLSEDVFSSWFGSAEFVDFDGDCAVLSVPSLFLKSWINTYYRDQLSAAWARQCPDIRRYELLVRDATRIRPRPNSSANDANAQHRGQACGQASSSRDIEQKRNHSQWSKNLQRSMDMLAPTRDEIKYSDRDSMSGVTLNPKLNFDSFVQGKSNRVAHAAACEVADGSPSFNPLLIHSPVGCGKTHLLHAIGGKVREHGKKVIYLTAEYFIYRFVAAIQSKSALSFKKELRSTDLLLIDDMQIFTGKQSQQEFCNTLIALINEGRQIVIAADRPPAELSNLDDRIKSRLSGGLVVKIDAPEYPLRRKILAEAALRARKRFDKFNVEDSIIDFVAENISTSGRDLEGALNRIIAMDQYDPQPLTQDTVRQALRDLFRSGDTPRVKIEDIQRVVAKHFQVSKADLLSDRRPKNIVRPRQIAMYLAKTITPRSLPEIGRRFGNRDHTTVLHAVRKIDELCKSDSKISEQVEMLKQMLLN